MAEHLKVRLPSERDYQTLAGYMLQAFRRLLTTGDHIDIGEWRFEVVDLDGNRIDKVISSAVTPASALQAPPPASQALAGPVAAALEHDDQVPAMHRAVDVSKLS